MSSEIRKKFGLDYLVKTDSSVFRGDAGIGESRLRSRPDVIVKPDVDTNRETLMIVGGKVLDLLKNQKKKSARLFQLVDSTGFTMEALLPTVEFLEGEHLIAFLDRDKKGNSTIN